jgi:hypothetical protein
VDQSSSSTLNFFDPQNIPANFGVVSTELIPADRTRRSRSIELGFSLSCVRCSVIDREPRGIKTTIQLPGRGEIGLTSLPNPTALHLGSA